jgi:hypothetical protein
VLHTTEHTQKESTAPTFEDKPVGVFVRFYPAAQSAGWDLSFLEFLAFFLRHRDLFCGGGRGSSVSVAWDGVAGLDSFEA